MSAITAPTVGLVNPMFTEMARIRSYIAAAALTQGNAVYVNANGKVDKCNTASSGKEQFRGIALETVGAGQAVDVLEEGYCSGFDVSGIAYDGFVYASDTAGSLDTAAGTKTVRAGRVMPLSDFDPATQKPSKVLYIRTDPTNNW